MQLHRIGISFIGVKMVRNGEEILGTLHGAFVCQNYLSLRIIYFLRIFHLVLELRSELNSSDANS